MVISAEYLAGFFDGEGHVGFSGIKRMTFQMFVTNCNLEVIRTIQQQYGGKLNVRMPKKPQHAISYRLRWSAKQAIPIMKAILPFLIVKKQEIAFILDKWNPLTATNRGRGNGPDYMESKHAAKDEFVSIARSRRGSYPLQVN